jgi:hypothetical protein
MDEPICHREILGEFANFVEYEGLYENAPRSPPMKAFPH